MIKSYAALLLCSIVVTALLSYPQAAAIGAPDRGPVATAFTLTLFWVALLAILMFGVALFGSLTTLLRAKREGSRRQFLIGTGVTAILLMATPTSGAPADMIGFLSGWSIAGGAGLASIWTDDDGRAHFGWRALIKGVAAATVVGLTALAIGAM